MIETNILGFTDLLARLVTIFRQRPSETSIVAVSSLRGETSVPFQAVYGASKAYVSTLVRGVSAELVGTGVSVGSFVPGGIDTGMAALSDLRWGKMGLMDVDRCASHAVKALVYRKSFTVPGLSNQLTYMASRVLPRSLVSRIGVRNNLIVVQWPINHHLFDIIHDPARLKLENIAHSDFDQGFRQRILHENLVIDHLVKPKIGAVECGGR